MPLPWENDVSILKRQVAPMTVKPAIHHENAVIDCFFWNTDTARNFASDWYFIGILAYKAQDNTIEL